jgi:hypothetical protein
LYAKCTNTLRSTFPSYFCPEERGYKNRGKTLQGITFLKHKLIKFYMNTENRLYYTDLIKVQKVKKELIFLHFEKKFTDLNTDLF